MPTKQELEAINDELLAENGQLRRESSEVAERLAALSESLQEMKPLLEAVASKPQRTRASREEFAAQIEPIVNGLKGVIESARQQTIEQNKRAQLLQTMLDRNEQASREFMNTISAARAQTHQLSEHLSEWQGQPRITVLKIAGATFLSMIVAGVMIVSFASWKLSPTRTMIEDATKWRVLTEEMPAEKVRQLEQQIENKLYQREQNGQIGAQTVGENPMTSAPAPSPAGSSPTPPSQRQNRQPQR